MKKLMIAAAGLALAATMGAAPIGQAQAAPAAKDPMCALGSQGGSQSWQDNYHCWGHYTPAKTVAHVPKGPAKDPMCSLGAQSGSQSWAAHYHCW